jgi:hypothetical protein
VYFSGPIVKDNLSRCHFLVRRTFAKGAVLFGRYTRSRANSVVGSSARFAELRGAAGRSAIVGCAESIAHVGKRADAGVGHSVHLLFEYRTGYPFNVIDQRQFLIGPPSSLRFPDYANLTIGLEKKFRFRGYLFAARIAAINVLGRENPDTVVNNIDAVNTTPSFLTFSAGRGEHLNGTVSVFVKKIA